MPRTLIAHPTTGVGILICPSRKVARSTRDANPLVAVVPAPNVEAMPLDIVGTHSHEAVAETCCPSA